MNAPWIVLLIILLIGLNISAAFDIARAIARAWSRRAKRRRNADAEQIEAEEIDDVAQAIALCYGHGPLRVMDPASQHEFRRDARAAIAAMKRRT